MNSLREIFLDPPSTAEQPRVTPIRARMGQRTQQKTVAPFSSLHNEQIHALVQQLFFRNDAKPVRHVGFAPLEKSTATATLCLQVATLLAEEGKYDVALIDARTGSAVLQAELPIASPSHGERSWPLAPRLWMVPRQSWLPDASQQRVSDENLSLLRETTAEFDFSILWCAPMSWLTASIGRACDGLVLVLAADRTRRIVAAHIREQLTKAQVPLLGSVLAGRHFPVPAGLYQRL